MKNLTRSDYGIAVAVGALLAMSPLTSPNLGVSIALGLAASASILAARIYLFPAAASELATSETAVLPSAGDALPLSVAASLLLFAALFAPTFQWLYEGWTASVWINQHSLFVPFVVAYLIYTTLQQDRAEEPDSSAWGFAFLAVGLLLRMIDGVVMTNFLSALGIVFCLPGFSLLFLGVERTRALAFPLALSVFMIPIPGTLGTTLLLREITTIHSETLLKLLGYSVIRTDTVLELPWGSIIIANSCSGLSTLYASITISTVLIFYCQTWQRRLLIALVTVPLALVANVVRALFLVMLSQRFGVEILDTQVHEGSGVATFAIVLLILYFISDMPRPGAVPRAGRSAA